MYYLIKSISGIFVTTKDKQEMLSEIHKIESQKVKYPSGNTEYGAQQRLLFINDVLKFLDTAFTKELYRIEKWKEKIHKSLQAENATLGFSWPQTEASYDLLQVKELLIPINTIPFNVLPTYHSEKSIPTPHDNNAEHRQQSNTEKIVEHTAFAFLHAGAFLHAQYTYNFYNEIVALLENEQRILSRQLSLNESKLLNWVREERDHAQQEMRKDGFNAIIHGAESVAGAIDESCCF